MSSEDLDTTQNNEQHYDAERLDRLSRRKGATSDGQSYSRFVRVMRLALPLAAVGLLAILFIRPGEDTSLITPVESQQQQISEQKISKNELLNPKFESMDKKSQPYEITAERAVQGEKNKDLIMLERPVGVMTMKDNIKVTMRSDTGAYRQDSERFFLQGSVHLKHEQGYSLHSEEAHIDLRKNFAWSEKDVLGSGPDISINAKGMHANGNTGEIVFTGPARLILEEGLDGVGQ